MLFPGVAVSQSVLVLTFAVKDQFDSLHTEIDYRGDATVLIGSDRVGSEYNGSWTKAIQDSIGSKFTDTNIKFLPVANVSSVLLFLEVSFKVSFSKRGKSGCFWVGKDIFMILTNLQKILEALLLSLRMAHSFTKQMAKQWTIKNK